MDFAKKKSSLLYCTVKKPMPNIFNCTTFKKHVSLLLDENENNTKCYLLLIVKEILCITKITLILTFNDIKQAADQSLMDPSLLNTDARSEVTDGYYKIMKKIVEVSNQNLARISDAFISSGGKVDPDNEFCWIDDSYKLSKEKFQLTY